MHASSANSAFRVPTTIRLLPPPVSPWQPTKQHMSDTDTSGTPTSASAETVGTTPPPASPAASQPFGTFGSTRGSGLARGKRAAVTTAPAAGTGGYQPSALEVIRPQSEYKNPFTGETSVAAPV